MFKGFFSKFFRPATNQQVINSEVMHNVEIYQTVNNFDKNFNIEEYPDILDILRRSSSNQKEENPIYSDLLKDHLSSIKELFNSRNLKSFEFELKKIIEANQFNKLPNAVQSEYLYLLGVLYIEKNEIDHAKVILSRIEKLNNNLHSIDLEFKIICKEKDSAAFDLFIKKSEECMLLPEKNILYKALFYLSTDDFKNVVDILYPNESLIESLKTDSNYFYYLGLAHHYLEKFDLANEFLLQSQKLINTALKKFLLCINILVPLLSSKQRSIKDMYKKHELIFNNCLRNLLEIEESILKDTKEIQLNFYQYLFTLYLYIDPNQIQQKMTSLLDTLVEEPIFTFYLAEMHFILKEYDLAYKKYRKLSKYKLNFEIQDRIFICMWELKKYNEIVNTFEDSCITEQNIENSTAYEIYLRSLFEINSPQEFEYKIQQFIGSNLENWLYYIIVGKLTSDKAFIKKSIEMVDLYNVEDTFYLALNLNSLNDTEAALKVLNVIKDIDEDMLIFYLELAISNAESHMDNIEKLISLTLNPPVKISQTSQNKFLAELYFLSKDFILSTDYYEIIWNLNDEEKTERNAYNILIGKILTLDSDKIDLYLDILKNTENPHYLMICGLAFKELKNDFYLSLKFFYRAISLLEGEFNENIYGNYIGLFLPISGKPIPKSIDFSNPITEVDTDCIVFIKNINTEETHRIFIHSDYRDIPSYKEKETDKHVTIGAVEETSLRKRKVGQTFSLNQVEYKIIYIENKFTNLYRRCFKKFNETDFPNKNFISLNVDPDNIEPTLKSIKEMLPDPSHFKDLSNAYLNNKIPLIILSTLDYSKLPGIIEWILLNPKYSLKSGPNNSITNNNKLVVSLSSLVFLESNNLLHLLKNQGYTLYFPKTVEIFIEQHFNSLLLSENRTATMYLDEQSNLRFAEITEEEKNKEINLWRNLLTFIRENNIIKKFKKKIPNISEMTLDLDSLNLAIDLKAVYISEDYIFKLLEQDLPSSNSAALIDAFFKNNVINYSYYIEILKKLAFNRYENYFSKLQLTQITNYLLLNERLYYRVSINLLKYSKLLDEYLKNKELLLWTLDVFIDLLKELQQNKEKENAYPLAMTIYDSLIKASQLHFKNPYLLIAYLFNLFKIRK